MPRVRSATSKVTAVKTVSAKPISEAVTLELADAYKGYTSLMIGGSIVPVRDGKVTVHKDAVDTLKKGGYVK